MHVRLSSPTTWSRVNASRGCVGALAVGRVICQSVDNSQHPIRGCQCHRVVFAISPLAHHTKTRPHHVRRLQRMAAPQRVAMCRLGADTDWFFFVRECDFVARRRRRRRWLRGCCRCRSSPELFAPCVHTCRRIMLAYLRAPCDGVCVRGVSVCLGVFACRLCVGPHAADVIIFCIRRRRRRQRH